MTPTIRTSLCLATGAAIAFTSLTVQPSPSEAAPAKLVAGTLTCKGHGGVGLILGSQETLRCIFTSPNGANIGATWRQLRRSASTSASRARVRSCGRFSLRHPTYQAVRLSEITAVFRQVQPSASAAMPMRSSAAPMTRSLCSQSASKARRVSILPSPSGGLTLRRS